MELTPFRNESFLNFSLDIDRKRMLEALQKVKSQLGCCYALKDGHILSQKPSSFLESRNPARPQEIVGVVQLATSEAAEQALQVVCEGSKKWKRTAPEKRIELLEKLAQWMAAQKYELAAWLVFEVGKNWREADADVCEAIDFCRYYAREMNRLSSVRVTQAVPGEHDTLQYFPKGVALVIAPWNFPLAILTGMTVAALVTGNTVILKPAGQSPVIAALLAQGLKAVGFPEDVFYFLPARGEDIGPLLIKDPRVDLIAFTGSADVGLAIIDSAAEKPKPNQRGVKKVIAEMGGKNALIIDEDADVDEALKACLHSAFGYQGQKCSALSRLLVHEKIYDSFVARLVDATKALRLGDPANPEYTLGPVVDGRAQNKIKEYIQDGKKRLKLLGQSEDVSQEGYYVPATLFEVDNIQEKLFQEEIFGPVVCVKKIKNVEEGVEVANSVRYALTGGLFSRNPSHIEYVKKEFEVGNLYINRAITGATVERHPFGGFKLSGIGSKAGGPDYLLQFLEPRTIAENTVRRGFA